MWGEKISGITWSVLFCDKSGILFLYTKLTVIQLCIETALFKEHLMISLFDDVSVLHYQNDIRFPNSGETVGNIE